MWHIKQLSINGNQSNSVVNLKLFISSRVAQWKRAGPITQRSEDQNLALLVFLFFYFTHLLTDFASNFLEANINISQERGYLLPHSELYKPKMLKMHKRMFRKKCTVITNIRIKLFYDLKTLSF